MFASWCSESTVELITAFTKYKFFVESVIIEAWAASARLKFFQPKIYSI